MPDAGPANPESSPPRNTESTPVAEVSAPTGRHSGAGRVRRPTWKLLQQLPQINAVEPAVPEEPDSDATPPPTISAYVWEAVKTVQNSFGLYREYPSLPTHDPEKHVNSATLSNIPPPAGHADAVDTRLAPSTSEAAASSLLPGSSESLIGPFKNSTIFGLMNWMWTGSAMKSIQEMVRLILFLRSDQFNKSDLEGFDIAAETTKFDEFLEGTGKKPLGLDVSTAAQLKLYHTHA